MNLPIDAAAWVQASPWLDQSKSNLLRDELQLARESIYGPHIEPIPAIDWINQHNAEQRLNRALARFAPMFPVRAHHGGVAVWTSPPPSGTGNAICIVLGHDRSDQLRLVGGNYFTEPKRQAGAPISSVEFFRRYDAISHNEDGRDERFQLVQEIVTQSISREDEAHVRSVIRQCELFHTMPIFITVLTDKSSLFVATPAVIEGDRPADFSKEFFGEVR